MDGYCFEPLSDETLDISAIGSYIPIDLMDQFQCTELLENMRQKDDAAYQELLLNVRVGNMNEKEAAMLESRVVKDAFGKPKLTSPKEIATYLCELLQKDENTICLVPTVEKMNAVNLECLKLISKEWEPIAAEHPDKKGRSETNNNCNKRKVLCVGCLVLFCQSLMSSLGDLIFLFREPQLGLEDSKNN